MHGLGNDYLYFDLREPIATAVDWAALSRQICDRHFGVGADGIILIGEMPGVDATMRIFNADGSESEMCGNGLRALAKWLYDRGLAGSKQVIATGAGNLEPEVVETQAGRATLIRVNMGHPSFDAANLGGSPLIEDLLIGEDYSLVCSAVSMGNPHLVVFGPLWDDDRLYRLGPVLERHPRFPDRINVHTVEITGKNQLAMRHWERGAGPTLACGTGVAGATALAVRLDRVTSPVTVEVPGGQIMAEWNGPGTPVYLTGPAEEVFEGFFPWP
ncbi:diaminopimelate epimerase [Sulfobacillus sp. DSM 109850]|uniref:Diaminopimelate epimerase n=2 Tax=Sulfobacillus harzensis TaxID=2729629 RepID=A0A7Y0L3G1_9FIRM|nr:diaminopimelate epimerase [Sulfobacillus harzensis]NMP22393.1 diaminopimelate epimerase [Sulfobacillus harzensis]